MGVRERNNIHVSGRGSQPMLFAHGFGCDQHMWRFVVPAFEPAYKVVVFDHVGAGHSDTSAYDERKYSSLDGYADRRARDLPRAEPAGRHLRRPFRGRDDRGARRRQGAQSGSRSSCWLARRRGISTTTTMSAGSRAPTSRACSMPGQQLSRLVEYDGAGDHRQRGSSGARRRS